MAAFGLLPWDGGYEMTVGLWQNSARALIRRGVSVESALATSFGEPSDGWWQAMTDSPEEAEMYKALHKAKGA